MHTAKIGLAEDSQREAGLACHYGSVYTLTNWDQKWFLVKPNRLGTWN